MTDSRTVGTGSKGGSSRRGTPVSTLPTERERRPGLSPGALGLVLAALLAGPVGAAAATPACQDPIPGTADGLVRVVASGEPPPSAPARIRRIALAELPTVRRALGVGQGDVDPFRIVVHRTGGDLPEALRRSASDRAPGFALRGRNEIHLILDRIGGPRAPLDRVVVHEIAHVVLDQLVGSPRNLWVPRWVHEGLAQQIAGHGWLGSAEDQLFFAARTGRLIPRRDLRSSFPDRDDRLDQAYAQSRSLVAWLEQRIGRPRILEALRELEGPDDFARALSRVGGGVLVEHEDAWVEYLQFGSGARFRFLSQNCFAYVGILAFVLLAAAAGRVYAREDRIKERLVRADQSADEGNRERGDQPSDENDAPDGRGGDRGGDHPSA